MIEVRFKIIRRSNNIKLVTTGMTELKHQMLLGVAKVNGREVCIKLNSIEESFGTYISNYRFELGLGDGRSMCFEDTATIDPEIQEEYLNAVNEVFEKEGFIRAKSNTMDPNSFHYINSNKNLENLV